MSKKSLSRGLLILSMLSEDNQQLNNVSIKGTNITQHNGGREDGLFVNGVQQSKLNIVESSTPLCSKNYTNEERDSTSTLQVLPLNNQDLENTFNDVGLQQKEVEYHAISEDGLFFDNGRQQSVLALFESTDTLVTNNKNIIDESSPAMTFTTLENVVPSNLEGLPENTLLDEQSEVENTLQMEFFIDDAENSQGVIELAEPAPFEELAHTEHDPPLNGTENANSGTNPNNIVNEIEEDGGEDLGVTKRGTKRVRKKKSTNPTERAQKQIKKLKDDHSTHDPCDNKCRYKCSTKFSEDWRNQCNTEFWNKNFSERRNFIVLCATKLPVKRRRSDSEKKQNSFRYFFNDTEGERIRVCKTFFLTTLGFSKENNSVVYDSLTTIDKSIMTGMASCSTDKRGKHPNRTKIDRNIITTHIESYNPSVAHYRREHAPNRRYLPSDVTIQRMYNDFVKSETSCDCSYDLYRKVINELNISFTKLGHEECGMCYKFKEHDSNHNQENLSPDCETCIYWKSHIERAEKSRHLYKEHANLQSSAEDSLFFCADLQKVIMLPRMDTFKEVIFTRRMVAFNESFVPVGIKSKHRPLAVLWHEAVSGRKKEDIINAFFSFFCHFRDVNHICIWLDNCSSQNKNWTLFTFFVYLLNYCIDISINKVDIFYFEPGHSFMAADSFHHQVELSMKHSGKVCDFQDFVNCVKKANAGKVDVKEISGDDLFAWKDFTSKQKLKTRGDSMPYLKDIVKLTAERGKTSLMYSTNYDQPASEELNFLQAKCVKKFPMPDRINKVRGFNKAKKKDIVEKLCPLMPANRRGFWLSLPESDQPDLLSNDE